MIVLRTHPASCKLKRKTLIRAVITSDRANTHVEKHPLRIFRWQIGHHQGHENSAVLRHGVVQNLLVNRQNFLLRAELAIVFGSRDGFFLGKVRDAMRLQIREKCRELETIVFLTGKGWVRKSAIAIKGRERRTVKSFFDSCTKFSMAFIIANTSSCSCFNESYWKGPRPAKAGNSIVS